MIPHSNALRRALNAIFTEKRKESCEYILISPPVDDTTKNNRT
jgi:hypothetical protein